MLAIIGYFMLVRFQKRNRIKRERMMLTIKLMGKYLAIECPAKSSRQDSDE